MFFTTKRDVRVKKYHSITNTSQKSILVLKMN